MGHNVFWIYERIIIMTEKIESKVKYPDITVNLIGVDGNAFSIMGTVVKELRKNKVSEEEITKFREECMSGDYNNLLRTCMKWVKVPMTSNKDEDTFEGDLELDYNDDYNDEEEEEEDEELE